MPVRGDGLPMPSLVLDALEPIASNDAAAFPYLYTILAYIVTHADINVSIVLPDKSQVLARPHYSKFSDICRAINHELLQGTGSLINTVNGQEAPNSLTPVPIGFQFTSPLSVGNLDHWRLRSRDNNGLKVDWSSLPAQVSAVYFPLIVILLPEWLRLSAVINAGHLKRKKFLYLVCGSGTPRTVEHDCQGNSTAPLGELIKSFITLLAFSGREIDTTLIDSGPGLFSFEANIKFVQESLTSLISQRRSELAHALSEEWPARFSLMIALKSGTVARTTTIMSSLRQFRPDYLHISEMKTFWYAWPHISSLWSSDVEFVGFDSVESNPSYSISDISSHLIRDLVDKMIERRQAFWDSCCSDHELRQFWLRKSFKPVLSVLQVVKADGVPLYFAGMNIEVSMPTGSLCAERSAIGNALAHDPTIHRFHMKAIAVLSLSMEFKSDALEAKQIGPKMMAAMDSPHDADAWDDMRFNYRPTISQTMRHSEMKHIPNRLKAQNPINPCGACKEWLKKIALANPDFAVVTFLSMTCQDIFIRPVFR
uniref:Uncharacterized protein n=1 Tax=Spongospora subterranea TaxID=70186 RepID=A0A0H5R4R2_9EUKA|eukprot:CRZ08881.1 hypothetical protein [Spongospora subterranea]